MNRVSNFFRRQRLRVRITLAFVGVGLVLAVVLCLATFLGVRRFLIDQRVRASTTQTVNTVGAAREALPRESSNADALVAFLQGRGTFQAMIIQGDDFFATSLALTPAAVPDGLRDAVRGEQLGYQFVRMGDQRVLVYGAPLPPPRTDIYLFYPLSDIDETMSVLLRVLLVTSFAVVAIAALLAQRVAGRVLRPLAEVSTATQRMAEGLLETRVRAATADELGVLAASFNEMASAFQNMIERERRFVANVSHELRTPLSTLRTASELLAAHRSEFTEGGREAVDLIAEDVANLRRLVEELMEVSEVDAGTARIRLEEVDLRALSEAIVAKMRRRVDITGDRVRTMSDKARLERILANLIDNAFEHGDGAQVQVAVAQRNGRATVAVSDHGPGIPPEDLPRLFDRFYKADLSRTREHGGIGLGLAIAFENAKLLGGSLEAVSGDAGTTFTLTVPMRGSEDEQ